MNLYRGGDVTELTNSIEIVRARASAALRQSGVEGIIPTPLGEIARWSGINEILDISEFNAVQRAAHRRLRTPGVVWQRFIGAVFFGPRVVLVDTSKSAPMRRWTEAHEFAHNLFPWHDDSQYLDDDTTLSRNAKIVRELEANTGAAHLLFQGAPFWNRALSYKHGLAVPVALADEFGTSIAATIRYYVETHPGTIGLICASRYVQNRSRGLVFSDQSPTFAAQFGSANQLLPTRLPVRGTDALASISEAVSEACNERTVGVGEMYCRDLGGNVIRLDVDAFSNGYNVFLLLQPHRRITLGRGLLLR